MSKIEIRTAYGEALKELGGQNEKIVVLEADVGSSTKSALFGQQYPDRYFNVGIAELNMVSMAAGLAVSGLVPFVNTFAVFLTTRGGDAIQSLIAHDKLNVKLAGAYSGLSDSYDGSSHQAVTDVAIMRALPDMTVISVCDSTQTRQAVAAAAAHNGPVYLRLSRAATDAVYAENSPFTIGKGNVLREGADVTIVAAGCMVQKSLAAAELLKADGLDACVIDMHTIKPLNEALLLQAAQKTGAVVTAEEHSVIGGLGGAVSEYLAGAYPVPVLRVGMQDCFGASGDYETLLHQFGLDAVTIAAKAREAIALKARK